MGNNRTPLLLGAMILIVGVWVADQFKVFSFVDNWGKESQAKLKKLNTDIGKLEDLIVRGADASDRLADYERHALPYNAALARSEYHGWLQKLVKDNRLTQSTVDVGVPGIVTVKDGSKKVEAYRRYGFVVNASGTLEQVTSFLFGFYRAGHLHKINSLSLNRGGRGRFTVSVNGEALGLRTCERAEQLSDAVGNRLAMTNLQSYSTIVRRNVFSREVGATLKLIKLSSITFDKSGLPEAWFKVGPQQNSKKLQRGESFNASVHQIGVIDIQPRSALLEVDGEVLDLPVGKTLFDVMTAMEIAANEAK